MSKKRKKELIGGGNPEAKFPMPSRDDWADDDYLVAKPIAEIGEALIASRNELQHLEDAKIAYLFKRKGTKKHGRAVMGTCQAPSGLLGFFSKMDFVVILMADHLAGATRWIVEAIEKAEADAAASHGRVEKIFDSPEFDKAVKEHMPGATISRENGVPTITVNLDKKTKGEARPS